MILSLKKLLLTISLIVLIKQHLQNQIYKYKHPKAIYL